MEQSELLILFPVTTSTPASAEQISKAQYHRISLRVSTHSATRIPTIYRPRCLSTMGIAE